MLPSLVIDAEKRPVPDFRERSLSYFERAQTLDGRRRPTRWRSNSRTS
jgi:hypothetical protein